MENDVRRNARLCGNVAARRSQRVEQRIGRPATVAALPPAALRRNRDYQLLLAFQDARAPNPKLRPPYASARRASRAMSARATGCTNASSSASAMPNTDNR